MEEVARLSEKFRSRPKIHLVYVQCEAMYLTPKQTEELRHLPSLWWPLPIFTPCAVYF